MRRWRPSSRNPRQPPFRARQADQRRGALPTFAPTRRSATTAVLAALKAGDWAGFGAELNALGPLLEQLSEHPGER